MGLRTKVPQFFKNPPYVTLGFLLSISIIFGFSFGFTGVHLPYIGNGDLPSETVSFQELGVEEELGADEELGEATEKVIRLTND